MSQIEKINRYIKKLLIKQDDTLFVYSSTRPIFTHSSYFKDWTSKIDKNYKHYIFLLGIKTLNTYHLNIVTYNKGSNTVERFDPCGVADNTVNGNIKNSLIDSIVKLFNLHKSPLYKDNGTYAIQKPNSKDCAYLCYKYVQHYLNDF
jgi:serine phosphatase RsbU (regulator of sigma subunit)